MGEKIIAIIPARGGSKGIPKKNIKDFCGKPLIAWSILHAVNSSKVDAAYVTSDSQEILEIAKEYGAKTIKRPVEISGDTSSSESAFRHALEVIGTDPEVIVVLQPTSPLRKPDNIDRALEQFFIERWDSCFSGAELEDFLIWRKNKDRQLLPINYDYQNRGRRQDRDVEFVENGSIYIFKRELFMKTGNRLGGRIGVSLMDFWQSFEIDQPKDWEFVELLFKKYLSGFYLR